LIAGKSLCLEINLVQERLDYDIGDDPSTVGNILPRFLSVFDDGTSSFLSEPC